eukprot:11542245-Heterocapsa_arctica.AAC.1
MGTQRILSFPPVFNTITPEAIHASSFASFNSLKADWLGVDEVGSGIRRQGPAQYERKTRDSSPPNSSATSHPFSIEPQQPFTPRCQFVYVEGAETNGTKKNFSPTLTWNANKRVDQHGKGKVTVQGSPRVNIDGAPSS